MCCIVVHVDVLDIFIPALLNTFALSLCCWSNLYILFLLLVILSFDFRFSIFVLVFSRKNQTKQNNTLKARNKFLKMKKIENYVQFIVILNICLHFVCAVAQPYDPDDKKIASVIPKEGTFEAFYPREMYGIPNSASRPPHSHGSFFKYRHPGLIESKNSPAYGKLDNKKMNIAKYRCY